MAWEVHDAGPTLSISRVEMPSRSRRPIEPTDVQTDTLPPARRFAFGAVLLLFCLLLFEFGSFVGVNVLTRRGWMAYIPRFTDEQKEVYLRERDPALGWAFTSPTRWGRATDAEGIIRAPIHRPDPAPTSEGAPCVSAYGDSFVYGTDVQDTGSFPHHLGVLLGCPVRNYGVPGYGSDQSLMLYRAQQEADSATVVIFHHLSENLLRNVNRYSNLLYPGSPLRFKPRFVFAGDSVVYLPAPVTTRADFDRVQANPDSALAPDALLQRPRAAFPFTIALIRWLATDLKVRARITNRPIEASYYDPDHSAGGVQLTGAILAAAVRDAAAHGQRGVIVLQMTRQGLIESRNEGRSIDQPLYDALRARGLPVVHLGPLLLEALGDRDPCEIFADCTQTHLTSEGNRIVAGILAEYLRAERLVPVANAGS